jgi:hypothetical protein
MHFSSVKGLPCFIGENQLVSSYNDTGLKRYEEKEQREVKVETN